MWRKLWKKIRKLEDNLNVFMASNSHYVCCGRSRVNKEDKIRQSVSSAFLSSIHSITISKSPVSTESWKLNNSASALSLALCTNSPSVRHFAPSSTERHSAISRGNSVWSILSSRSFPKCLTASEKFRRSVRRSLQTLTSLRSKTLNSSDWKENDIFDKSDKCYLLSCG